MQVADLVKAVTFQGPETAREASDASEAEATVHLSKVRQVSKATQTANTLEASILVGSGDSGAAPLTSNVGAATQQASESQVQL